MPCCRRPWRSADGGAQGRSRQRRRPTPPSARRWVAAAEAEAPAAASRRSRMGRPWAHLQRSAAQVHFLDSPPASGGHRASAAAFKSVDAVPNRSTCLVLHCALIWWPSRLAPLAAIVQGVTWNSVVCAGRPSAGGHDFASRLAEASSGVGPSSARVGSLDRSADRRPAAFSTWLPGDKGATPRAPSQSRSLPEAEHSAVTKGSIGCRGWFWHAPPALRNIGQVLCNRSARIVFSRSRVGIALWLQGCCDV